MQLLLPREQTGLPRDSRAQVELIGPIRRDRILRLEGKLPLHMLQVLDQKIREHLDV